MAKLLFWRPLHRGSLRGFCTVEFASGLRIADICIHIAGSRVWASSPSKPWLDDERHPVLDERGKIRYSEIISFS